jgi:hypothetical protein
VVAWNSQVVTILNEGRRRSEVARGVTVRVSTRQSVFIIAALVMKSIVTPNPEVVMFHISVAQSLLRVVLNFLIVWHEIEC